jgi:peptidyl-prolyl cis-trans isomerase SurA
MKLLGVILFSIFSLSLRSEVIDKIVAVIDVNIITLSQIERIQDSLASRKNISPPIYYKDVMSTNEVVQLLIQRFLIRAKLEEQGYVIGDDQVEGQIQATEKRLGLNREALMSFLKSNNLTFNEYFEIIRETIEFNIFNARVIKPLISITDQEIKNLFYQQNSSNNTFTFKYHLIDYYLEQASSLQTKKLVSMVKKYRKNGILDESFKNLQTIVLGDVTEDGISLELREALKKTRQGGYTPPIQINNAYHVFYVKEKDLVESEVFNQAKEQIKGMLYAKKAKDMIKIWVTRESSRHYLKFFYKKPDQK